MTPDKLLALCVFLAVSSATLLIYLAFCKAVGRTRTRGGDLADPDFDPFPGSAPFKSPVTKPVCAAPPETGVVGRGSGLGALIALVIVALLVGCLWQVARVVVRSRFEQVIGKITTDRQLGIDFDRNTTKAPDFQVQPFQVAPLPLDGLRGIGAPAGLGGGGAPAPGNRAVFRFR